MYCHCRTDTSTTVDIHGPFETIGTVKPGAWEDSVSEPVMNAHDTANVTKLYVATIELLHKIIEIRTICDQNVSRACAGYHLFFF